jgi:DNA-directed RNA polymerase specialized sigma24 family protein
MRRAEDRLFARFCRSADPGLLAEVFDRTATELQRVAAHLCGDRARGEDLVQETFVCAIESRARFDVRLGVVPWLLEILVKWASVSTDRSRSRTSASPMVTNCRSTAARRRSSAR